MSIRNRGGNISASPAIVTSIVLCALKQGRQAYGLFVSLCVRYVGGGTQTRSIHRVATGVSRSESYGAAAEYYRSVIVRQIVRMVFLKAKKKIERFAFYLIVWCPEEDSNLHTLRHTDLNRARLPIPPSGLHLQRRAI